MESALKNTQENTFMHTIKFQMLINHCPWSKNDTEVIETTSNPKMTNIAM